MNLDRTRLAERIDAALAEEVDQTKFLELAREIMKQRPFPYDLMHKLTKGHLGPQLGGKKWEQTQGRMVQALREHGGPSARAADPNHPVGQAASAILAALPNFERWEVAPEEIVGNLVARYGPDSPPEPESLMPPGFTEGRSCARFRLASGVVIVDERGRTKDMRELMREAATVQTVGRQFDQGARLSDVMDLLWTEPRRLELRDVERQLRQLAGKVVADSAVRFSAHEAACYRAALRMHLGDGANPVATGGVLQASPKQVEDTSAVHVRIYLEVWASVMSGTQVEFRSFPSFSLDSPEGPNSNG